MGSPSAATATSSTPQGSKSAAPPAGGTPIKITNAELNPSNQLRRSLTCWPINHLSPPSGCERTIRDRRTRIADSARPTDRTNNSAPWIAASPDVSGYGLAAGTD
jgi:hypothetical protein